jgi:hypothetical protein
VAYEVVDTCIPGLKPVDSGPAGPFAAGVFRSPTSGHVIQLAEHGGRQIVSINGADMSVASDAQGVLRPVPVGNRSVILSGDRGSPTSIRYGDCGRVDELIRQKPATTANGSGNVGRYRSDSAGIEAILDEDGTRLTTSGPFGSAEYRLEPLAASIWRARSEGPMPWGGVLTFNDDGGAFQFSTARTWDLTFRPAR